MSAIIIYKGPNDLKHASNFYWLVSFVKVTFSVFDKIIPLRSAKIP